MESKRVIAFCSSNQNKVTEFETILRTSFPALLDSTSIVKAHLDLAELQGHPEEISRAKCRLAYEKLKCPVIVEDTSLGFNAFKGLPGPYIKWFLEKLQPQGLADMLKGQDDRSGFAMTIFSYWDGNPNEGPLVFQGRTDGYVAEVPRGEHAFGWDPIFIPNNGPKTYAEMTRAEKNAVSHRGKAVRLLGEHLMNSAIAA